MFYKALFQKVFISAGFLVHQNTQTNIKSDMKGHFHSHSLPTENLQIKGP